MKYIHLSMANTKYRTTQEMNTTLKITIKANYSEIEKKYVNELLKEMVKIMQD